MCAQHFGSEGLGQIDGDTCFGAFQLVLPGHLCRDHDDGNVIDNGVGAYLPAQFQSVDSIDETVYDDQVGNAVHGRLKTFIAVCGKAQVALAGEYGADEVGYVAVVFDNQQMW